MSNPKPRDLEAIYTRKSNRYQCDISTVFVQEFRAIFDALVPAQLDLRIFDQNPLLKRQTIIDGIVVINHTIIDEMHQLVVDFVNVNTLYPHLTQNASTSPLLEFVEVSALILRIAISQPGTPLLRKFILEFLPFLYQLCSPTTELHSFALAFANLLTQIVITGHFDPVIRLQSLNMLSSLLTDFNALFRDIPMIARLLKNDTLDLPNNTNNNTHTTNNNSKSIDEDQITTMADENDPKAVVYSDLVSQRELLLPLYDALIRPIIQPLFFTIPLTFDLQLLLPLVSLCMKLLSMFYVLETLPGDGVMFTEGFLTWLFPILRLHLILDPATHDDIYHHIEPEQHPSTLVELIQKFNILTSEGKLGNSIPNDTSCQQHPPSQPPPTSTQTLSRLLTTSPNFSNVTELALNALQLGFARTTNRIYAKSLATISGDPSFVQFAPFLVDVSYINSDCQSVSIEHVFCHDPDFEVVDNILTSTLCLSLLPHIVKNAIQLRHKFLSFLDIEMHLFYQISYDEWYETDGQFEFMKRFNSQAPIEENCNTTVHLSTTAINKKGFFDHSALLTNTNSQLSSYNLYDSIETLYQHYPPLPAHVINQPPPLSETIGTFLLQVDQFYTNTDDTMAFLLDVLKFTHHNLIQQYPLCSISMVSTRVGDLPPIIAKTQQEYLNKAKNGTTSARSSNQTPPIFVDEMPEDPIDDWTQSALQNRPGLLLLSQPLQQVFLYQPRVVPFSYIHHSSRSTPTRLEQSPMPPPIDFTHPTNPETGQFQPLINALTNLAHGRDYIPPKPVLTKSPPNPVISIIFPCDNGFPAPHTTFLAYDQYCFETISPQLFDADHLIELHRTSHPPLAVIRSLASTSLQLRHHTSHLKPINSNFIDNRETAPTHPNLDLTTMQLKPKYPKIKPVDQATLSLDQTLNDTLLSLTHTFFPNLNPAPQVERPPDHLLEPDRFRSYTYIPALEQKLFSLVSQLDNIANDCLPVDSECGKGLRSQLEQSYLRGGVIAQFDQQLILHKYEPLQAQYPLYHPQKDQFWQNEIANLIAYCEQLVLNFVGVFGPPDKINRAQFSMRDHDLLVDFKATFQQLLNAINTFQCIVLQTSNITTWCDISLDYYPVYIPPLISADSHSTVKTESLEAALSFQFIKSQGEKDWSRNKSVCSQRAAVLNEEPEASKNKLAPSSFASFSSKHQHPSQHQTECQSSQFKSHSRLMSRSQQLGKHPSASSRLMKSVAAKASPQHRGLESSIVETYDEEGDTIYLQNPNRNNHLDNHNNQNTSTSDTPFYPDNTLECLIFSPFATFSIQVPSYLASKTLLPLIDTQNIDTIGVFNAINNPTEDLPQQIFNIRPFSYIQYLSKHQSSDPKKQMTTSQPNQKDHEGRGRQSSSTIPAPIVTIAEISQFSSSPSEVNLIPSAGVLFHTIRKSLPLLRVLDLRFYPATVLDAESLNGTLFNPDDALLIDNIYFYNWFVVGPTAKQNGGYLDRLLYRLGLQIIGLARPNDRVDTIGVKLLKDFVQAQKRQFILNQWIDLLRRCPLKASILHYLEAKMNANEQLSRALVQSNPNNVDSSYYGGSLIEGNTSLHSRNQLVVLTASRAPTSQISNNNQMSRLSNNNSNEVCHEIHKSKSNLNNKQTNPDTFANLRNLKEQSTFNNPALPHVVIGQNKLVIFEMPASFWDPAEHNILSQPTTPSQNCPDMEDQLSQIDQHNDNNDLFAMDEVHSILGTELNNSNLALVQLDRSNPPDVNTNHLGFSPSPVKVAIETETDTLPLHDDSIPLYRKRKLNYTPRISPLPLLPTPKELEDMALLAQQSSPTLGSIAPSSHRRPQSGSANPLQLLQSLVKSSQDVVGIKKALISELGLTELNLDNHEVSDHDGCEDDDDENANHNLRNTRQAHSFNHPQQLVKTHKEANPPQNKLDPTTHQLLNTILDRVAQYQLEMSKLMTQVQQILPTPTMIQYKTATNSRPPSNNPPPTLNSKPFNITPSVDLLQTLSAKFLEDRSKTLTTAQLSQLLDHLMRLELESSQFIIDLCGHFFDNKTDHHGEINQEVTNQDPPRKNTYPHTIR